VPQIPARFVVTVDRLDGGEPIEEREVREVELRGGIVRIHDGATTIFAGAAWNWLEVRQIDYAASVALDLKAAPKPKARRQPKSLRTSK
jgi:hypothetical protein